MPKYVYRCNECDSYLEIRHSMQEKLKDCIECDSYNSMIRVPQMPNVVKKTIKGGTIVKEFIEQTKKELSEDKTAWSQEEHK